MGDNNNYTVVEVNCMGNTLEGNFQPYVEPRTETIKGSSSDDTAEKIVLDFTLVLLVVLGFCAGIVPSRPFVKKQLKKFVRTIKK